jgi:acetyl-CoA carboxylase biotin carboxyl carrier protein
MADRRSTDAEQRMTLDEIKHLIEFLREQDVTEFELDYDGVKLRVRSGTVSQAAAPAMPAASVAAILPPSAPAPANTSAAAQAVNSATDLTEEGTELAIVKSPIVGTFYRAPEPTAKPFVSVGDTVRKGDVLCIIEAMKLMNEIDSEYDGEVTGVYVENGQAVQYGERLFAIKLK